MSEVKMPSVWREEEGRSRPLGQLTCGRVRLRTAIHPSPDHPPVGVELSDKGVAVTPGAAGVDKVRAAHADPGG